MPGINRTEYDDCGIGLGETIALTTTAHEMKKLTEWFIVFTAGAAPTTSENLLVIVDRSASGGHDSIIFDEDLSTYGGGVIDFQWNEEPISLGITDQLKATYANTDDLAIDFGATMEL